MTDTTTMSLLERILRPAVDAVIEQRDDIVSRDDVGEIVEEYTADLEHDLTVEITQHVEGRIDDAKGGEETAGYREQPDRSGSYGGDSY